MINDPVMYLLQAMRRGKSPRSVIRQMAMQDPQVAQFARMTDGKSAADLRTMAENMAEERGIDLGSMAQQMGLQLPK